MEIGHDACRMGQEGRAGNMHPGQREVKVFERLDPRIACPILQVTEPRVIAGQAIKSVMGVD